MGSVCRAGYVQRKLGDVHHAPHRSKLAHAVQRVYDRDAVYGLSPVVYALYRMEYILMPCKVKVGSAERLHCLLHGCMGQQHAAQYRFFRLKAVGRRGGYAGFFHILTSCSFYCAFMPLILTCLQRQHLYLELGIGLLVKVGGYIGYAQGLYGLLQLYALFIHVYAVLLLERLGYLGRAY